MVDVRDTRHTDPTTMVRLAPKLRAKTGDEPQHGVKVITIEDLDWAETRRHQMLNIKVVTWSLALWTSFSFVPNYNFLHRRWAIPAHKR